LNTKLPLITAKERKGSYFTGLLFHRALISQLQLYNKWVTILTSVLLVYLFVQNMINIGETRVIQSVIINCTINHSHES